MNYRTTLLFALSLFGSIAVLAQDDKIRIQGWSDPRKVIPISMSGYSGEAQSVLKFDLEVAGFEFVDADKAAFQLSGSNNGKVEGRLSDRAKTQLFARAYNGPTTRLQAHALANDVIFAVTGVKGVTLSKIAFKVASGGASEIYVADYDGHGATRMTRDNSEVAMPSWAGPRKLVYCFWKSTATQILVHDLNSGARQVLLPRVPGNCYSAAASPDGRKVALISNKSGNPDLYVCDIDGTNLKRLTETKEDESSPCWSPDSSKICYVSRHNTRPALFVVSANGGETRRLSIGGVGGQITEPDWSPDGNTIVFTSQGGEYFSICTMPATGGTATVITEGQDPCWAANSRTVIFTRQQNNKRVLSLLDAPTKRVKDVAQISGSCSQPSWAR